MNLWTSVVIVMGMIFGTGFTAILLDYLQKRRKLALSDERRRIEDLERKVELQEQQIVELTENQQYALKLIEDQHDQRPTRNQSFLPRRRDPDDE